MGATIRIPGTTFQAGYVAKGVVYALIGLLAIRVATGEGGRTAGADGALAFVGEQPFGQVLLWVLAVGLFLYATWRLVDGLLDASDRGSDTMGVLRRIGVVVSGGLYTALGVSAIRIATSGGGGGGQTKQELTAWLLSQPGGAWIVGIVGLIVAGVGLEQLGQAWRGRLPDALRRARHHADELRQITRAGLAARGLTFCVIGALVLQAAAQHDPSRAGGLDQALATLAAQPFGPWLLGLVALGLVCYGVSCFAIAAYGRFPDVEIADGGVHSLSNESTAH